MASCFRDIFAKNRQNPLILFKVTIDNVGVPFLRHSVLLVWLANFPELHQGESFRIAAESFLQGGCFSVRQTNS